MLCFASSEQNIVLCLTKYLWNPILLISICLQVDICLSAFVNICTGLIPGLLALITKGYVSLPCWSTHFSPNFTYLITVITRSLLNVNLFVNLKLVLTLAACAL